MTQWFRGLAGTLPLALALGAAARAEEVEVSASALNVRAGPGTSYPVQFVARQGERLTASNSAGDWREVQGAGRRGWAHGSYLRRVSAPPAQELTVTANALHVRSGPGVGYRVLGLLHQGDRVRALQRSGDWRQVAYGASQTGWVHGAWLSDSAGSPGATRSSAGFVQLPASGAACYSYSPAARRWGRPALVYGLQRAAERVRRRRPASPRLGVGDLSFATGGPISGHRSHQRGVDADLRPLRNDGREAPTRIQESSYSRSLTQEALDACVAEMRVTNIFFNDRQTRHTQTWPNHDNHFHVRIAQ